MKISFGGGGGAAINEMTMQRGETQDIYGNTSVGHFVANYE